MLAIGRPVAPLLSARTRSLYYSAVNDDPKLAAPPASAPPNSAQKPAGLDADAIPMPKLSLWRRMQIPIIAAAVYSVIRVIGPTLRVEIVGIQNAAQIRNKDEAGIGVFWHRCIFPAAWIWRDRGVVVMNTVNFDGQWTRKVIEWLGFGTAQGSSSRGGMRGLAVMARRLSEGLDCAFTIDGPRGPRYIAKPGPVMLARKTRCPVMVFHIGVDRGITFEKTWDHFLLPKPFARA